MSDVDAVDALDVYLHGSRTGLLERRSQAKLRFGYGERWVAEEGRPLSLSLPVRSAPYEHEECAPFFEGLLPEGDFLKAIARTLHVSASNPFQLLTDLGGECAGAISVAPAGGPEPGQDPRPPRWLSDRELAELLAELPRRPLIAAIDEVEDGGGFRLSLAGAQDKVGVVERNGEIGLSHGHPPTTEIVKAPIPHVDESVVNEAFCMSLAARVDLDTAEAVARLAESWEYLLVRRYDRSPEMPDGRVHQEDFCQALGLVPAVKYESEGGPSVADCADLIRRHCSAPARDITAFLDALLFNFVIANHDAHSKNYSLLLDGAGAIRLAPLYDLIATVVFSGTDRKLAMRYGGENRPRYIRGRHLDRLAKDLGVKPTLVRRRALAMRERVEAALADARRTLPAEFQDRPILERIEAVVLERGEMLAARASEARQAVLETREDQAEHDEHEFASAMEAVNAGLSNLGTDLEAFGESFNAAVEEPEVELVNELHSIAKRIREHGRDVFDAVVDVDTVVVRMLGEAEEEGDGEAAEEFLALLVEMDRANENLEPLSSFYGTISDIERLSPLLRGPVRGMRAGVRDAIDAREIVSEWGARAKALRSR